MKYYAACYCRREIEKGIESAYAPLFIERAVSEQEAIGLAYAYIKSLRPPSAGWTAYDVVIASFDSPHNKVCGSAAE